MIRSRSGLAGLLTAQVVSLFGTRLSFFAIPWLVLVTTGSAAQTGLVAFAETAPYVVVMALGGPLLDRAGPRRCSVAADLAAAPVVATVPMLHAFGALHLAPLALLVAVTGALRAFGDQAKYVVLPVVIERAGSPLQQATGLFDLVNRLATMLAGPLAGVLIAAYGAPLVLVVDAATFLVGGLAVALTVPRDVAAPTVEREPYLPRLRAGLAFLRADRLLCAITLMVLVTNLLDQAYSAVLVPVWAHDRFGSATALGLVAGAFGIGAVLGNAVITAGAGRLPRYPVYTIGFLLAGAPRFAVLGLGGGLGAAVTVSVLAGLGVGGLNPIISAIEYERIPEPLRARVLGASVALSWAGIPAGSIAGGALVGAAGLRTAFLACGAAYLLATLAPLVFPSWRGMRTTAPRRRESPRRPAAEVAAR